jgi:hypothetical protein
MQRVILQIVVDGQSSNTEGLHLALGHILYVVPKPSEYLVNEMGFQGHLVPSTHPNIEDLVDVK